MIFKVAAFLVWSSVLTFVYVGWRGVIDKFFLEARPETEETAAALMKKLVFHLPLRCALLFGIAGPIFVLLMYNDVGTTNIVISALFGAFNGALLGLFTGIAVAWSAMFVRQPLKKRDTAKSKALPVLMIPVGLIFGFFSLVIPIAGAIQSKGG